MIFLKNKNMEKLPIKVYDGIFSHFPYSCMNCNSDQMVWIVNPPVSDVKDGDVVVFTDESLIKVKEFKDKNIVKIAWFIESPVIVNQNVIFDYIDDFDEIYTVRRDFLEKSPKFKFLPYWCMWIKPEDRKMYSKSKLVSIIASHKRFAPGHHLRHEVISKLGPKFDLYGNGYRPIGDKIEGLKDYRFSIVIENCKQDYYFTEKLMDCFVTGTIPIYWGCPSIGNYFDPNGILQFDSISELNDILNNLSEDQYNKMLPYVHINFNKALKYKSPEDYMIDNLFKTFTNTIDGK
jgi:hypothetical protein